MTKELEALFTVASQAISMLGRYNGGDNETLAIGALRDMQRNLEQYVCIPKGKNRHPYADVLHQWVEGADIEYAFDKESSNIFYKTAKATQVLGADKYRIKPPEPIFEWQWKYKNIHGIWQFTPYLTDDEFKCYMIASSVQPRKDEETKRERK